MLNIKKKINKNILYLSILLLLLFFFNIYHFYKINEKTKKLTNFLNQNNKINNFDPYFCPIIIYPEIDSKNSLLFISFSEINIDKKNKIIEYSLVFKDEDHPSFLIDIIYDFFRSFKYKRIVDIESFYIRYLYLEELKQKRWIPVEINFPNTFSNNQNYFTKNIKHYSEKLPASQFYKINDRIVIFVNTWNHLLSNNDNNVKLNKIIFQNYQLYQFSRINLEKYFKYLK
ncbi:MAG: hypothetical protein N3A58_02630 [Spirochaetes bacterium]|nr:hypothetical protein [Spirochaetota bacterium]